VAVGSTGEKQCRDRSIEDPARGGRALTSMRQGGVIQFVNSNSFGTFQLKDKSGHGLRRYMRSISDLEHLLAQRVRTAEQPTAVRTKLAKIILYSLPPPDQLEFVIFGARQHLPIGRGFFGVSLTL
jgi:hypothetical protein